MAFRPKDAGNCHVPLPYEFPDETEKVSQNFKVLAREVAELKCREVITEFTCEDLLAVLNDGCDICPFVCECPCDVPSLPKQDPHPLAGIPFENIYGNGLNLIGNIDGTQDFSYWVFDPITEVLQTTLKNSDGGNNWDLGQGFGAAYHPTRNEFWLCGSDRGAGLPYRSLRVYDAGLLAGGADSATAFKVQYDYPTFDSQTLPCAIEYCEEDGMMWVGMAESQAGDQVGVIDPSNGLLIRTHRCVGSTGFEAFTPYSMVWHEGHKRMYMSQLRDRWWWVKFDGSEQSPGLSCAVGGIVDTGFKVPEITFSHTEGFLYQNPNKYSKLFKVAEWPGDYTGFGCTGGPGVDVWVDPEGSQDASHIEWMSPLNAIMASRGDDSIIFADKDTKGRITLYAAGDGAVLRDFESQHNVARVTYCPNAGKVSGVTWWDVSDSEFFLEYWPLGDEVPPDESDPDTDPGPGSGPPDPDDPGGGEPADPNPPEDPTPPDPTPVPAPNPPPPPTPDPPGSTPENPNGGVVYNVTTGLRSTVLGLRDPAPIITLEGLNCTFQPAGGTPYTGTVRTRAQFEFHRDQTVAGTNWETDLNVQYYVMNPGEHPETHPTADPFFGPTAEPDIFLFAGNGPFDYFLRNGARNYTNNSVVPGCLAGTTDLDYDIYFRLEESAGTPFGIIISPWFVHVIRTKVPEEES